MKDLASKTNDKIKNDIIKVVYRDSEAHTWDEKVKPETLDEEKEENGCALEYACDSCSKRFNFDKDISDGMCDECLIVIAKKENIDLPNKYQCEITLHFPLLS